MILGRDEKECLVFLVFFVLVVGERNLGPFSELCRLCGFFAGLVGFVGRDGLLGRVWERS